MVNLINFSDNDLNIFKKIFLKRMKKLRKEIQEEIDRYNLSNGVCIEDIDLSLNEFNKKEFSFINNMIGRLHNPDNERCTQEYVFSYGITHHTDHCTKDYKRSVLFILSNVGTSENFIDKTPEI